MILAGTGHRPNKLHGTYSHETYTKLVSIAKAYFHSSPVTEIISGCALGWDQALFDAALQCHIPVHAAIPFQGFVNRWTLTQRIKLDLLLNRAAKITYVCEPGYAAWKLQQRNMFMVDNSDGLVALWNGSPGGTANCIAYAKFKHKPFDNLWVEELAIA